MSVLLDYVFPISVITPVSAVSTAFLKQVCLVVKPKSGQEGNVSTIYECDVLSEVSARTDNTNASQFFNAGMSKVYILLADDLDLEEPLNANPNLFFTLVISDDFDDEEIADGETTAAIAASLKIQDITYTAKTAGTAGNSITIDYNTGASAGSEVVSVISNAISIQIADGVSTAAQIKTAVEAFPAAHALVALVVDSGDDSDAQAAFGSAVSLTGGAAQVLGAGINVGTYEGVVGVTTQDEDVAADQAVIANRVAFFSNVTNKAKNMTYAFGKLLSNLVNWRNQQYITMPFSDGITTVGQANSFFDDRVSFVLDDDQSGKVLAFFSAGGKAIVAPYILKNFRIDLQSRATTWISANQPQYTNKDCALLEEYLVEKVVNLYIERKWIEAGTIDIKADQGNFVASGAINVSEPKALWRIFSEMQQTL
jgi:hypothetical protein